MMADDNHFVRALPWHPDGASSNQPLEPSGLEIWLKMTRKAMPTLPFPQPPMIAR
jgi:hypothetical protein